MSWAFGSERGSVASEFALVIPIILLITFGSLQILFLVNAKVILQQAAFDAVRSAAVYPEDIGKAREIISEQVGVLPVGEAAADSKPRAEIFDAGDEIRVKVTAEINLLPLINQAVKTFAGSGQVKLSATATAKKEPYLGLD